jgi:phage recombination protein Bet
MSLPSIIQSRGISTEVFSALKNSLFPGASDESVAMAWDYCAARGLDVMLKPVHLVPMYVKDKNTGQGSMRDVVMPGIGLYRIQADRAGNYAGMSAPSFGPDIVQVLGGIEVAFPEWCEITVSKLIGDRLVTFTAREYWIENYATAGKDSSAPNAMWKKRPRGQLVKCAEAQALRKGWPELGAQPTAEEMEGKEIDITSVSSVERTKAKPVELLSVDQIQEIKTACEFADVEESAVLKFCQSETLESIPAARFDGIMKKIKKKLEQSQVIEAEKE